MIETAETEEVIITHCVDCGHPLSARTILRGGARCRSCSARQLKPTRAQRQQGPRNRAIRERENRRLAQLAKEAGLA